MGRSLLLSAAVLNDVLLVIASNSWLLVGLTSIPAANQLRNCRNINFCFLLYTVIE